MEGYITALSVEPDRSLVFKDQQGDYWAYIAHGWRWGFGLGGLLSGSRNSSGGGWGYVQEEFEDSFPLQVVGSQIDGKFVDSQTQPPGPGPKPEFTVKDSGAREEYANGFVRDTEEGKYDYARVLRIEGLHLIPIEALERWGAHMVKGAEKYGEDNWRQARGPIAVARFLRSLCRHVVQYIRGDRTEDHAAAVCFNVWAAELTPENEGDGA